MTESQYIAYRKLKAAFHSAAFYLCRIFPIDKKLISVCTFEGKGGFGCNPKYIVQELHKERPDLKFVWLVNKVGEHNFPDYIREVPNSFWSSAYWLTRSKIWIDNYRKPLGTVKRRGQYYINTWHGCVGFKPIGLWRGEKFSRIAYLVSKNDSDMIDRLIVSNDWSAEVFVRGMVYDGKILKLGQAREDVMSYDRTAVRASVREKYNLPADSRIVLYAPTYRESGMKTNRQVYSEQTSLDISLLKKSLHDRFGGEWYVLEKLHPQLAANHHVSDQSVIDVSKEDDTNWLIASSDAVVTDYSSVGFEAGVYGIPVFLYMDDLKDYVGDRGNLCFEIHDDDTITNNKQMAPDFDVEVPFVLIRNNEEMAEKIALFDIDSYLEKTEKMTEHLGWVKDGKASNRISNLINEKISI
ncbi:MAG: CDP-glycerol glycerophosphotransferase family protein [Candidatus Weimeria sp.]